MNTTRITLKRHGRAICCAALAASLTCSCTNAGDLLSLSSPNGRLHLELGIRDFPDAPASLFYRVKRDTQTLVPDSCLGLVTEQGLLGQGLRLVGQQRSSHDEVWRPVYGEREQVRDRYHQLEVEFEEISAPHRKLKLTARAYDEGVAWCYTVPAQEGLKNVTITREHTEFRLPGDHPAWAVYSAQGRYAEVRVSAIRPGCERPLVIKMADDLYIALAEARLVDYARMKFAPLSGQPHSLVSRLDGQVVSPLPLTTPWRVVMVADSPGRLLEQNDLILNLNDPCAIEDTSWIRPGKVIREITLTTAGGKACVDFAATHGLQYVEYDAGWYGPENDPNADATTVTLDPKRSRGPLDLHEVIRYAKSRGIGIILYVNRRALERQMDVLFPLYQQWGVAGVKFGFVHVGSQRWTRWLHEAVRKAAAHKLMVDVHDEYRPTGYSRTYPNLMTQEGIAGDESRPDNEQTLTLLFTRMLAGAADNTICYYDGRVDEKASHAYQLAKAVCFYSPWQFLFWYDRPPGSPGAERTRNVIADEPELEFFAAVPTVWDDTRVIEGRIGEYAVLARRKGPQWFVGAMNSNQPRQLWLPLTFLDPQFAYTAHIYTDDPSVPTRTHVRIERRPVTRDTVFELRLPARGGEAIRLEPAAALNTGN